MRRFLKVLSLPAVALALGATVQPASAGVTANRPAKLVAQQPARQASAKQRVETIQPHRIPMATQPTASKGNALTAGQGLAPMVKGLVSPRPAPARLEHKRYPLR
jgi:hypothetical protein